MDDGLGGFARGLDRTDRLTVALAGLGRPLVAAAPQKSVAWPVQQPPEQPATKEELASGAVDARLSGAQRYSIGQRHWSADKTCIEVWLSRFLVQDTLTFACV